jgi:hypothetical protein
MSADIVGININAGASIICQQPDGPVRVTGVTDGTSNTIMIVEDARRDQVAATDRTVRRFRKA